MLEELNTIKFEQNVSKKADYTPVFQLTKVSDDSFHLYSFETKSSENYNAKGMLKAIASLRGGSYLSADLTKQINSLGAYESVTITKDALRVTKSASIDTQDKEPWKLVAVNGVEYFVKADCEEDEDDVNKQASDDSGIAKTASASLHNYTVRINAHNVTEIAKIAGFAEESMGAQYGSFETNPADASISFIVASPDAGYQVQDSIHKALENGKIFLPQDNVVVADEQGALCGHHHGCPCCGGNPHQDAEYHRNHDGMASMKMPGNVVIYADKPETLKEYADAHAGDMQAQSSEFTGSYQMTGPGDANTAFQHDNGETQKMDTFASILDSFLHRTASVGFEKAAEEYNPLVKEKNTGAIKNVEDPATQEEVKNNPDNYQGMVAEGAPAVPAAPAPAVSNPADQPVKMEEQPSGEGYKVKDPNEKPADETKQQGDDGVKRWKGMREDPKTGKYIVYITENEQHIYDNLNDAMNFMVRK